MKRKEECAHNIATLAQRAILYEVSTTPKPGLVDRDNSGSHKDMDYFTFMASSSVLYRGLFECALEGFSFEEEDSTKLLDRIRIHGVKCEKAMFKATDGVNTHKGIIFSLGILSAVVGNLHRKNQETNFSIEQVCEEVKKVAKNLTVKDFKAVAEKKVLTHGETLFKEYGYKGIRGEVESGFNTVRANVLHILRDPVKNNHLSKNDLFLEILINIMAYNQDTNVVIRGGLESLVYVKDISKEIISHGGISKSEGKKKLEIMNRDFIEKNISPGGSADLLAVSIFLGMVEGLIK